MIYVYRTLWLLFYLPILIIELILFIIGIPLLFACCILYFIKCGDVEEAPDWCVPGKLSVMLHYWYRGFLDKTEEMAAYERKYDTRR